MTTTGWARVTGNEQELLVIRLLDPDLKYGTYERFAIVKRDEDDKTTWGVVAWAPTRKEARRVVRDIYARREEMGH